MYLVSCIYLLYTPISRWIYSSAKSYKTFFYTSHFELWTPFMQNNFWIWQKQKSLLGGKFCTKKQMKNKHQKWSSKFSFCQCTYLLKSLIWNRTQNNWNPSFKTTIQALKRRYYFFSESRSYTTQSSLVKSVYSYLQYLVSVSLPVRTTKWPSCEWCITTHLN